MGKVLSVNLPNITQGLDLYHCKIEVDCCLPNGSCHMLIGTPLVQSSWKCSHRHNGSLSAPRASSCRFTLTTEWHREEIHMYVRCVLWLVHPVSPQVLLCTIARNERTNLMVYKPSVKVLSMKCNGQHTYICITELCAGPPIWTGTKIWTLKFPRYSAWYIWTMVCLGGNSLFLHVIDWCVACELWGINGIWHPGGTCCSSSYSDGEDGMFGIVDLHVSVLVHIAQPIPYTVLVVAGRPPGPPRHTSDSC